MVRLLRLLVLCSLWLSWSSAQEATRFRVWLGGQEVGGQEVLTRRKPPRECIENREWVHVERQGMIIDQKISQTAWRAADGTLEFQWTLHLSKEFMEGRATWNPANPRTLKVFSKGLPERVVDLEEGTLLWPEAFEARLREAARTRQSVRLKGYKPALQQPTELELRVVGPDPLPGFPDAVHFQGRSREGAMVSDTDVWVSPTSGEVKESGTPGGLAMLVQRVELPAPPPESEPGFFSRTLNPLPPHPFLPWLASASLRWQGPGEQHLPEDDQQKSLGLNRIRLSRALAPSHAEATQLPVSGKLNAEDAIFLAPSPLLQFQDPAFDGLLKRLHPPAQATRWQLAKAVNQFVFEWITVKDYTVGFASALEVAQHPRGDCTEHSVLAVALLRRLGVPARGVVGWVGASGVMGMHFWVEVRLQDRWVPIDPTFDETPASALHLKLASTDLADLGSVGWDTAATKFVGGSWVPEAPWAEASRIEVDTVLAPNGEGLRLKAASWRLNVGELTLKWRGTHPVEAVSHPQAASLKEAQVFDSPRSQRRGWWHPREKRMWLLLDEAHWLQISAVDQAEALELLDQLQWLPALGLSGFQKNEIHHGDTGSAEKKLMKDEAGK